MPAGSWISFVRSSVKTVPPVLCPPVLCHYRTLQRPEATLEERQMM